VCCLDPPTGDQIAFDGTRVMERQLTRVEGMRSEAAPVAEETYLASQTALAQFSVHRPLAFADGPELLGRRVGPRRVDRGVRRHDSYFVPSNVKSCVWAPVTALALDVAVTVCV